MRVLALYDIHANLPALEEVLQPDLGAYDLVLVGGDVVWGPWRQETIDEWTIVCGHTHGQFDRWIGDRWIVNAGSVGEPFGDRGAYFAMFEDGDVELCFAPYDVDQVADAIVATGYPYGPIMVRNIRSVNTAQDAARWFEKDCVLPRN